MPPTKTKHHPKTSKYSSVSRTLDWHPNHDFPHEKRPHDFHPYLPRTPNECTKQNTIATRKCSLLFLGFSLVHARNVYGLFRTHLNTVKTLQKMWLPAAIPPMNNDSRLLFLSEFVYERGLYA